MITKNRPPQVAGLFYPSAKAELENQIKLMLDITKSNSDTQKVRGIIAPHAGYSYSGTTAAYAYNRLGGQSYERVIVISPSHREYFEGCSIFSGDSYETPLGIVDVDKEFSNKLISSSSLIYFSEAGHRTEHALEVHLPFLQTVLKDFKLVPIVMGDQKKNCVNALADSLAQVVDENTLVVASSDLSHFHNSDKAEIYDSLVEKHINNFEYEELFDDLETDKCSACGGGPIVAMLKAFSKLEIKNSKVLHRCNSGDVSGDYTEVVGYLSAVFYK